MSDEQTAREDQFLIAEYNQCWQMIGAIDERRGKFLQSITTLVVAAVGAVGFLLDGKSLSYTKAWEASAVVVMTLLAMLFIVQILQAEREANVRRRKWVNVIRETILKDSSNPAVETYLNAHKDLGVKISSDPEPRGIGSTLGKMFILLGVEALILLGALVYIWMRYYGSFPA